MFYVLVYGAGENYVKERPLKVKKKFVVLAVAAFFIVLLVILQRPISQPQDMAEWPQIEEHAVMGMVLRLTAENTIELIHKQGVWYLKDGSLANQDAALRLRYDLAHMRPIRMLTRGHKHDAELGFSASAIQVQCLDAQGHVLLDIAVGKQGSDLLSTYVRRTEDDVIYAMDKLLLWQLKRTKKAWKSVDKKVE